ncbi:MAG: cytochrome c3 family protein [Candidatus Thiodiazotropha sp.]
MKTTGQMLRIYTSLSLLMVPLETLAENVDCRSCHGVEASADVVDLSPIYANPALHHPVEIGFPAMSESLRTPQAQSGDVSFFDRNGNSQPDPEEIQLFGQGVAALMTCSTCHVEHGTTSAPQWKLPMYLRVENTGSGLCSTCHIP